MTRLAARLAAIMAAALPLAVITPPPAATAQIAVYDPAVHAQSVLSAARALEQIRHQIAAIEQQARMLERSQLYLSPELTQSIRSARDLFTQAEALAFDIGRIGGDIEALYPETWEAYDLESVLAQSQRWRAASREAYPARWRPRRAPLSPSTIQARAFNRRSAQAKALQDRPARSRPATSSRP